MRNAFSALLFLTTVILFFSMSVTAQQDPVSPTANGTISGRVTASDGVTPISDVQIDIFPGGTSNYNAVAIAYTSGDGSYITNVPPGTYSVYARKNGYVAQYFGNQTFRFYGTLVTVTSGQSVTNINFMLHVTATVSGRVTEADGVTPIENARIVVETQNKNQCNQANTYTYTGADGTYTTDGLYYGLSTGTYTVYARKSGYVDEYYANQTTEATANGVPLTTGNLTPNINFTLDEGGTISGKVTAADGITPITVPNTPVVQVLNLDGTQVVNPNIAQAYYVVVGADGTYALTGLPPGSFIVQAYHDRHVSEYYPNQSTLAAAQLVTVTANTTTPNIDFSLDLGGTITGSALFGNDIPISGMPIEVVNMDGVVVGQGGASGAEFGAYTIYGIPPGSYYVRSGVVGNFGVEYYPNQASAATATLVTVTAGATTPNINFSLDFAYGNLLGAFSVAGVPSEYYSTFPYSLHVIVTPSAGGSPAFDGMVNSLYQPQFVVDRILPGNYTVTVQGSNALSVTKTNVTVSLGSMATPITIGFLRGGDADGNNLVNILDFSLLATSFGKVFCEPGFDARADFNRDNLINITDFSILATYFGQSG